MTLPAVFLCICVSTLPVPVQKGVPNIREQEKAVTAYLHLDPHDKESWAEGERILAGLDSVPFPKGSRLRGWTKFLDKWRRKEASKLPEKAGEYFDLADGTSGRYFIDGELKKPKGLFIGMHGGGVGSGDASSSHSSYTRAIEDRDWIGIFPEVIEKTECGWTDSGTEEWVLSLVERALDTFDIDPDKVYFGGHSMGGYGSWVLGAHHADRVAALMPSAGAPTPIYGASGNVISVQKGVVPNLRNVPMCVFQSTDDPKVGPEANQAAVKVVERSRVEWGGYENFEYWEVSDKGHGWPEGGPDALVAKIDQYTRDSHPIKVVWQPRIDWKRQFYWLWWDAPELRSTVVAEVDREAGTIDIELTRGEGEGLHVLLSEELVDMEREVTIRVNGLDRFQGVPEPSFSAWVRTLAYRDPGLQFPCRVGLAPE